MNIEISKSVRAEDFVFYNDYYPEERGIATSDKGSVVDPEEHLKNYLPLSKLLMLSQAESSSLRLGCGFSFGASGG